MIHHRANKDISRWFHRGSISLQPAALFHPAEL